MKYICDPCGHVYNPELGDPNKCITPGTAWENVPEEWRCPLCSAGKDHFSEK